MKRFLLSALAAFCAFTAFPAFSATFTYDFTAERAGGGSSDPAVTIVDTAASFATITGTLTFDNTFVSASASGDLYAAPSLSIDQFSLASTIGFTNSRVDNGGFDQLVGVTPGLPPTGEFFDRVNFILRDTTGAVFPSTAFPDSIDLADFNIAILLFTSSFNNGTNSGARERRDFNFTELTRQSVSTVPLPAGLPLLASGLALLGFVRRRKAS